MDCTPTTSSACSTATTSTTARTARCLACTMPESCSSSGLPSRLPWAAWSATPTSCSRSTSRATPKRPVAGPRSRRTWRRKGRLSAPASQGVPFARTACACGPLPAQLSGAQRRARAEAAGRRATLSPASKPQDVASRSRPCRTAPAPPPHHGCAEPAEPARATRSGSDPSSPRGTLMRSNVSRETIGCLRTGVSRETFGPFAVSSGTPRAARSRCPSFAACGGGTRGRSARRAGRAGGARGARGGRASRRVRREWARFSIGLTTGWQAGWQRLHAMHDYLGPSSKA